MHLKTKLLIIISVNFLLFANATYVKTELSIGESFIYDIVDAGYFAKIGSNEISYEGYKFGVYEYPIGIKINATIEEIGDVVFNLQIENISRIAAISANWFDVFAIDFSYLPLYITYEMVGSFNNIYIAELILYQIRPYIDPLYNNYLSNPLSLKDDIDYFVKGWSMSQIHSLFNYTIEDNLTKIESWIYGKIDGEFGEEIESNSYRSDISFGTGLHIAVDSETGIVYGYRTCGWVKGRINGLKVKVSMKCQFELEGYDLPDQQLSDYRDFSSGIDYLAVKIAVPITCFLIIVPIFVITNQIIKKRNIISKNS